MSVVNTYKPMIAHLLSRQAPGKLIATSSEAALLGTGYAAGYGTTKATVMGLTRALAIELGRYQIQVNAVLPVSLKQICRPIRRRRFGKRPAGARHRAGLEHWTRWKASRCF